jgi:non-reducing end alpha-L-arabinofuranosidase
MKFGSVARESLGHFPWKECARPCGRDAAGIAGEVFRTPRLEISMRNVIYPALVLAAGFAVALGAASCDGTEPVETASGGAPASGGSAQGGTSGNASGGTANATGGRASGGISTGGTATGGKATGGSATGGNGTAGGGPCDIYQSANTPCVGAFSTVRALYAAYNGPLYQVRLTSNKTVKDIPVLATGGFADSSVQDSFCGSAACTISKLYDQSPQHNDMPVSGKTYWLTNGGTETNAKAVKINVSGHPVYGVKSFSGQGNSYRAMTAKGTATGDQPEAMYEVVDSTFYNALCCNDFGNAETTGNPDGAGTMEAIYFGNDTMFGSGGGNGPWLLADLEAGTFPSNLKSDTSKPSLTYPKFATLMLKGFSGNRFVLKHGDGQTGTLTTQHDGARPSGGYSPMKKQGAIVLGAGGDGSFYSQGIFFEGAITSGCPDVKAVDDAIQANIVAAKYGQ